MSGWASRESGNTALITLGASKPEARKDASSDGRNCVETLRRSGRMDELFGGEGGVWGGERGRGKFGEVGERNGVDKIKG